MNPFGLFFANAITVTATPEPSSLTLLAVPLTLLGAIVIRRRSARA